MGVFARNVGARSVRWISAFVWFLPIRGTPLRAPSISSKGCEGISLSAGSVLVKAYLGFKASNESCIRSRVGITGRGFIAKAMFDIGAIHPPRPFGEFKGD